MDIRKLTLINTSGATWGLNGDTFITDLSGLGFEKEFDFENVGDFLLQISKKQKQMVIKGTVINSNYLKVLGFLDFIQQAPLVLKYEIPLYPYFKDGYLTYFRDVEVQAFKKGEMKSGAFSCDIELLTLGNYYEKLNVNVSGDSGSGGYSYTYPFTYSNNAAASVSIDSTSFLDSPTKITIFGPCTNPSWSHYVNGVEAGSGKVNCSVIAGERMIIDCQNIPYSIKKYDNSLVEVEDCYGASDFSTGRFIYLKYGVNEITFAHEGAEELNAQINAKINFQGV